MENFSGCRLFIFRAAIKLPHPTPRARIHNLMSQDLAYWLAFSFVPCVGPARFHVLENHFQEMAAAWRAGPAELSRAGLEESVVQAIVQHRARIDPTAEWARLERLGVRLITHHDAAYPTRLKEAHDHPALLFLKGELKLADDWCVAVVGTRQPTIYGRQVAEELAGALAQNHVTVVSGLARGVDTIAHRAALAASGRTLAVLGGGLDNIYPPENTDLARRVSQQGALLSEYPPGTRPRPDHFPRRNRILAGLCLGTLVVEAGAGSGALITAQLAMEQNREVFAVPGSILSPASEGTNKLIQDGAKLVRGVSDILEELNLTAVVGQLEMKEVIPATPAERELLKYIGAEPHHIDEICQASRLPAQTVSATLAMMELKGMVRQMGAMNYALVREAQEKYIICIE
jgi:DNA processing protein